MFASNIFREWDHRHAAGAFGYCTDEVALPVPAALLLKMAPQAFRQGTRPKKRGEKSQTPYSAEQAQITEIAQAGGGPGNLEMHRPDHRRANQSPKETLAEKIASDRSKTFRNSQRLRW